MLCIIEKQEETRGRFETSENWSQTVPVLRSNNRDLDFKIISATLIIT
jgi:hypothetical protein